MARRRWSPPARRRAGLGQGQRQAHPARRGRLEGGGRTQARVEVPQPCRGRRSAPPDPGRVPAEEGPHKTRSPRNPARLTAAASHRSPAAGSAPKTPPARPHYTTSRHRRATAPPVLSSLTISSDPSPHPNPLRFRPPPTLFLPPRISRTAPDSESKAESTYARRSIDPKPTDAAPHTACSG